MQKKILIIDDEKQISDSLKRYLTVEGYDVDSLNDPMKAMKKIEDDKYFLIILDIAMPGINGIELLKMIKGYNGAIQVVMMTGHVTIDNLISCMRRGASDCIFKPFNNEQIKEAVEDALARLRKWERLLGELIRQKR